MKAHKSVKMTKNYSVLVPGQKPIVLRQTTTINHAIKHAAFVSELMQASKLQISIVVMDNRTEINVLEIPAIDSGHAIKPSTKRDKRTTKILKKAAK